MSPAEHGSTALPEVEVRRSRRRTKTVSAYRKDGRVVVLLPDRLSAEQEAEWVRRMLARLERSERRGRRESDSDLARRAEELAAAHLPQGVRPTSVQWVATMTTRWASCTPSSGAIRVSERVRSMPAYVVDYVLLHELAHLVHPDHSPEFWALVGGLPRVERARGYLDGVAASERRG